MLLRCRLLPGRGVSHRSQRLIGNQIFRVAATSLGKRCLVSPGRRYVLCLEAGRRCVLVVCGHLLLRRGGMLNAAGAPVVRNAMRVGDRVSFHTRSVNVGIVNRVLIHAHDRGVIGKLVSAPLTAVESNALIAEAIVHASVVTYVAAPVAPMKSVTPTVPVPIVRRPECSVIGSRYPCAGHPIVVALVLIEGPVAGHPHQVGLGAVWLFIDRKFRRRESDTDDDLCMY
jgi:hypothetical protein